MTHVRRAAELAAGLVLAASLVASASAEAPVTVATPGGEVTVTADHLEQIGPEHLVVATGHVEILRGQSRLLADRAELDRETGDAVATGHVIFYDGEDQLEAERIDYNFRNGTGVVYHGDLHAAPYYRLKGERIDRVGDSLYEVYKGSFTTCEADPPPWSFHVGSAHADLESHLTARDVSFWVKNLPLIPWMPFLATAIRRERQTGFLFPKFGVSATKGFITEVPFFWAISDSQDLTIAPIAYTNRGYGGSADYRYLLSGTNRGWMRGFLLEETERHGGDKGWGLLHHDWYVAPTTPGLWLKGDVRMVTDDTVLREYGDGLEERSQQRLKSNLFATKTWPTWDVTGNLFWYQDLTTRRPVELNRLPELSVTGTRQPVPGVPGLLYSLDAGAVRFVREIGSDGSRLDVHPQLARPISPGGLFTITPFAGGRATAYDRTVVGSRTTITGETVEVTNDDARIRRFVEAGADAETVLSRVYPVRGWLDVDALQHSIEPRVTYTRVKGWNMARAPQWTELEQQGNASLIEYSLTNRVRSRSIAPEGSEPSRYELVRLVVAHSLDLENPKRMSGDLLGTLIVAPTRQVSFRSDVREDTHRGGINALNTDVSVVFPWTTVALGNRFSQLSQINFLQASVVSDITSTLRAHGSTNWDLQTHSFVENRAGFDLRFQCYAFSIEVVDQGRVITTKGDLSVRFAVTLLGMGGPIGTSVGLGGLGGSVR